MYRNISVSAWMFSSPKNQCCGPVVYPGSEFFLSWIQGQIDSGSRIRIRIKELLTQILISKLSEIWSGSWFFLPIPDHGSRGQKDTGYQIRIRNTAKKKHKIGAPCWKARGPHSVLGDERGHPVVMIVSDQNFPAVLFSKDRDPCLAILRIEDGMLKDLGFAFLDLIKAGLRIRIHFIRIRI